MPQVTLGQLISDTREFMDAVGPSGQASGRWSESLIKTVLNSVHDAEWDLLLDAAPYYTFAMRNVTTDANGQVALSALNSGSGDSQQNFRRAMSVSDGNVLYSETRFQDVPLATTTNYLPTYPRMYYQAGDYFQFLPVSPGVQLYVSCNWKPTALLDLASNLSTVEYPANSHLILVYAAAAQLLRKGGSEATEANVLARMADEERATMLDNLRRRTINPTRLAYPDLKYEWAGG